MPSTQPAVGLHFLGVTHPLPEMSVSHFVFFPQTFSTSFSLVLSGDESAFTEKKKQIKEKLLISTPPDQPARLHVYPSSLLSLLLIWMNVLCSYLRPALPLMRWGPLVLGLCFMHGALAVST